MSNKRWICPLCSAGKLAPSKPRKDDVRRFCLPCSEKTGRLVERTCPALDAQRAKRKASKAEQDKRKRAAASRKKAEAKARQEARLHFGGFDLRVELKRIWNNKEARKMRRDTGVDHRPPPPLVINSARQRRGVTGFAYHRHEIRISIPKDWTDAGQVLSTLSHEVAHRCLPNGEGHSNRFFALEARLAREVYSADVPPMPPARAYAYWQRSVLIGEKINEALKAQKELQNVG